MTPSTDQLSVEELVERNADILRTFIDYTGIRTAKSKAIAGRALTALQSRCEELEELRAGFQREAEAAESVVKRLSLNPKWTREDLERAGATGFGEVLALDTDKEEA